MLSSPNLFRSAALSFIRPAASVTSVAFPALSTALRARRGFTSATSNLRPPTASDITNLKYLVSNVLVGDKDDLSHYNNDWLRTRTGKYSYLFICCWGIFANGIMNTRISRYMLMACVFRFIFPLHIYTTSYIMYTYARSIVYYTCIIIR